VQNLDPDWPIGYPFEAIDGYDTRKQGHIDIVQGDKGVVVSKPNNHFDINVVGIDE